MAKKSAFTSGKKGKKSLLKRVYLLLCLLLVLGGAYLFLAPNTGAFAEGEHLYISTGASYESVKETLVQQGFLRDIHSFDLLAKNAGYTKKVLPGRYQLKKGMSNFAILRLLRSGKQSPVRLVITKLRTKSDFEQLVDRKLEPDSITIAHLLRDNNYLAQFGLDSNTAMCAIMPNTYEFYWNSSVEKIFRKIAQQYIAFWNDERKAKAEKLGLTPQQVIVVASIVEEETNYQAEKSLVSSVYINRLRKGMRLQADPTARFAFGDFMIKRITGLQTSFESPYNTYQVAGLPPGPICTPSAATIDAVLQTPRNEYLYFCAKEDFSGRHNFAQTLQQHNANARKYHQALNARGIH